MYRHPFHPPDACVTKDSSLGNFWFHSDCESVVTLSEMFRFDLFVAEMIVHYEFSHAFY